DFATSVNTGGLDQVERYGMQQRLAEEKDPERRGDAWEDEARKTVQQPETINQLVTRGQQQGPGDNQRGQYQRGQQPVGPKRELGQGIAAHGGAQSGQDAGEGGVKDRIHHRTSKAEARISE